MVVATSAARAASGGGVSIYLGYLT
jgi:hypothetical protein